jgi:hypothetical protein
MTTEAAKAANEPMAWYLVTGFLSLAIILLGVLLKLTYNSFVKAIDKLETAITTLNVTTGGIRDFLAGQKVINGTNEKDHESMRDDIEEYHKRLNATEKMVEKIKIIEQACPANPNKELLQ